MSDQPIFSRRGVRLLLLLSVALILIGLPRFDRNDWLIGSLTSEGQDASTQLADSDIYIKTIEWIRGEGNESELMAPWSYRLLVPLLAAPLPVRPITGINLVNLLFLIPTLFLLFAVQRRIGIGENLALFGCGVFIFSFPTFYYSTVGYVDPVLLFALALGLFLILEKRWLGASLVIGIGSLAKEGTIILLPLLAVALFLQRRSWKDVIPWTAIALILWGAVWFATRKLVPVGNAFQWEATSDQLSMNLTRARSWLTLALCAASLFFPFVVAIVRRWTIRIPRLQGDYLILWTGLFFSVAYYLYSWIVAYVDGRMFWPIYIFAIPLVMASLIQGKTRRA